MRLVGQCPWVGAVVPLAKPPRSPLGQAVADAGDHPQGGVDLAVEGAGGGHHDHHPAGGGGGVDAGQEAVLWAQGGQGGGGRGDGEGLTVRLSPARPTLARTKRFFQEEMPAR